MQKIIHNDDEQYYVDVNEADYHDEIDNHDDGVDVNNESDNESDNETKDNTRIHDNIYIADFYQFLENDPDDKYDNFIERFENRYGVDFNIHNPQHLRYYINKYHFEIDFDIDDASHRDFEENFNYFIDMIYNNEILQLKNEYEKQHSFIIVKY